MSDLSRRKGTHVSRPEADGFLDALRKGHSMKRAAEMVGRPVRTFYYMRERDEEFARRWEEALEEGTQFLEDEVRAAVVEGTEEVREVLDAEGRVKSRVVTRRRHPQLAVALLKKRDPAGYREGTVVQVAAPQAESVEIQGFQPPTLRDVLNLARRLGLEEAVDGEASEDDDPPALPATTG